MEKLSLRDGVFCITMYECHKGIYKLR